MSDTKQQKINANLHEDVKKFVNSEDSNFSDYKHFYEEAAREKLEREQLKNINLTSEELKMVKKLAEKELK